MLGYVLVSGERLTVGRRWVVCRSMARLSMARLCLVAMTLGMVSHCGTTVAASAVWTGFAKLQDLQDQNLAGENLEAQAPSSSKTTQGQVEEVGRDEVGRDEGKASGKVFANPYDFERLPALPEIEAPTTQEIEASINLGLKFLLDNQNVDGSFGSPTPRRNYEIYAPVPGAHHAFQSATTALCVSAMLEINSADPELAQRMPAAIDKAAEYLRRKLPKLRRAQGDAIYNVWGHAYSIRAMVRLINRPGTSDDLKAEYRELIAGQIQMLGKYESVDGGWGYCDLRHSARKPTSYSISFVNATGLIAFYEARQIGIEVPQKLIDRAYKATMRQQKPDLSYLYAEHVKAMPMRGINNPGGSLARSQACNLAMRLCGDEKITINVFKYWLIRLYLRNGWLDIGRKMPVPHSSHMQVSGYFYYYGHYYAGQVIDLLPKAERGPYQSMLAKLMIDHQQPNGAWWDYPLYDYHRQYGTAYALMALVRCLPGDASDNLGTLKETLILVDQETAQDPAKTRSEDTTNQPATDQEEAPSPLPK